MRDDLPLALAALQRGELTEDRAFAIAREVAHLDPAQRRRVEFLDLRDARSTSPPLPGGPSGSTDYSPAELQLVRTFTLIA